jgi:AcrR family transcriptional regulator
VISTSEGVSVQGRGRPRDAGVDDRALAAVVEELAEVGIVGFSVNSVSARAKVSKRSIASRWPDRRALILAGMGTLAAGLIPPHTGRLAGDLEILGQRIADIMVEPRRSILARCAAELEAYPEYYAAFRRDSVDRCMAAVQDVLVDARARSEVDAGLNLPMAADYFVSAIIGSAVLTSPDSPLALTGSTEMTSLRSLVHMITRGLYPRG